MTLSFSIGKYTIGLKLKKTPAIPMQGYTSRTMDGLHCLFMDYDGVNPEVVAMDIENLKGVISHAFVFCTDEHEDRSGIVGNYHVICLDKMPFSAVYELMRIGHSDTFHRDLAKITRYRSWVLRFSEKGSRNAPKLVRFIDLRTPETDDSEQSQAHYRLIKTLYPEVEMVCFGFEWNFDKSKKAIITQYFTTKEKSE